MNKNLILLSLLLISCSPKKNIIFDGMSTYRTNRSWKQDFKNRVLCNCILQGINVKSVSDTIYKIDHSFSDEIEVVFRKDISDVLNPVIHKMKQDSLQSLATVAEGAAGKHVFDTCIEFYKSKKLDSISRIMLRKWNKMPEDSVLGYVIKQK